MIENNTFLNIDTSEKKGSHKKSFVKKRENSAVKRLKAENKFLHRPQLPDQSASTGLVMNLDSDEIGDSEFEKF